MIKRSQLAFRQPSCHTVTIDKLITVAVNKMSSLAATAKRDVYQLTATNWKLEIPVAVSYYYRAMQVVLARYCYRKSSVRPYVTLRYRGHIRIGLV